ncbi:MAG: GNAT family N-acetyltransferase [Lachnospiraceae bacterium]|nr:GNAT family N-acetyltransferase [Lachnospiraceae bacterium]
MIRLRPYKPSDAWKVLEWWDGADEETFVKWSCGKFEYPLTIEQLDGYFSQWCLKEKSGWLMTALDESGSPVGHFIMRLADFKAGSIRMGFIVVDPAARGKGYGKKMIAKALTYAFDVLGMRIVTLGVFENNPQAKACYEAVGFKAKEYVPDYLIYKDVTYPAYEMEAVCHE